MVEFMNAGCLLSVKTDDWWIQILVWERPFFGYDNWVVSGSTIYESWGLGFLGCFTRWDS